MMIWIFLIGGGSLTLKYSLSRKLGCILSPLSFRTISSSLETLETSSTLTCQRSSLETLLVRSLRTSSSSSQIYFLKILIDNDSMEYSYFPTETFSPKGIGK
ncbi:hypothetical protein C1646_729316 [Rhizophagus diaphanus]|nr:hypothetical protein C1646_729316 [Rhizophagus diaphanus] [Rhizophagus sp. MUCL 43196]